MDDLGGVEGGRVGRKTSKKYEKVHFLTLKRTSPACIFIQYSNPTMYNFLRYKTWIKELIFLFTMTFTCVSPYKKCEHFLSLTTTTINLTNKTALTSLPFLFSPHSHKEKHALHLTYNLCTKVLLGISLSLCFGFASFVNHSSFHKNMKGI